MSIDIGAEFMLDLGKKVNDLHTWNSPKSTRVWDKPFMVNVPLTGFDQGTLLSPEAGTIWSLRRLTLFGYTVTNGSLQILLDGVEPLVAIAAGATAVTGPSVTYIPAGGAILTNTSRLTVSATGVTGSVTLAGRADAFEAWYLSEYLD